MRNPTYLISALGMVLVLQAGCTDSAVDKKEVGESEPAPVERKALGPEYVWLDTIEEPEIREVAEQICRRDRPKEREIPGPKGAGPVTVDEFHPRRDQPPRVKQGGRVVQRIADEPRVLNRYLDTTAAGSEVDSQLYEGLIALDKETWDLIPLLAERYAVDDLVRLPDGTRFVGRIEDPDADPLVLVDEKQTKHSWRRDDVKTVLRGCVFTFWLRRGVEFHNGEPFDADDVIFMWKIMKTPEVPIPHIQSYYQDLESFEKLDQYTVRAYWAKPYWRALDFIGGILIYPSRSWDPEGLLEKDPKRYGELFRNHKLAKEPVGTGPYKFKSWRRGYSIVLESFVRYHSPQTEPRHLDELHFRVIVDELAALLALEAGEVDFVDRLSSSEKFREFRERTQGSGKFVYVETLLPAYYYVAWNLRRPMFQDRRVRWALGLGSVDLDLLVDEVFEGKAVRVTHNQFRYGRAYHPGLPPLPYDPSRARALLARAGWWDSDGDNVLDRDGEPFKFELLVRNVPASHPLTQMAERMKANLKNLGIRMSIRRLDQPSLVEVVNKRDYDAVQIGWALGSPPHETDAFQAWHSTQMRERGSNHISYNNPIVDRLIEESRAETDWIRRRPLQRRISEQLYRDQGYLFLLTPTGLRVYSGRFRGVQMFLLRPGYEIRRWFIDENEK